MRLFLLCLLLACTIFALNAKVAEEKRKYKFLVYSPQHANSHVNFLGKISDVLVEAGHDVTMISPIVDVTVGTSGTKKAKVIEIPQCHAAKAIEEFMAGFQARVWTTESIFNMMLEDWSPLMKGWAHTCNATIHHPGLLEHLRNEKFDVGYSESMDLCSFGLFYLAGIKSVAVTQSMAIIDGQYFVTQTPSFPAYTPSMMAGGNGAAMTFFQRLNNAMPLLMTDYSNLVSYEVLQKIFEDFLPEFPPIKDVAANTSLVFLNSEPLIDFPRVTSHRIIDIGGIIINGKHQKLNVTWSAIMDLRPKTVLLSFGSFAKAYRMPEEYKETIRKTLAKFPEVTFIWKYEKPEHNVSRGVPNIIESTWVPQVDMLYDPRLTAFITHCGQGSTTEANMAGVPLLVIPMGFDQLRNAQMMKRNGVGIMLDKTALRSTSEFEEAIREILDNESLYKGNAQRLAAMLHDRPFQMREIFVRNMEFLAKYGPLRQLDHEGRNLNFLQFYLIDVFSFLTVIVLATLTIILGTIYFVVKQIFKIVKAKPSEHKKTD